MTTMSSSDARYVIRRGLTRGAGDYSDGDYWTATRAGAFVFDDLTWPDTTAREGAEWHAKELREMGHECRVVRLRRRAAREEGGRDGG